jgi:polysaccharide export outer membrane protein
MKNSYLYILLILIAFSQSSCVSNKRLTYFNGLNDSSFYLAAKTFEPTIQKGDILYIGVTSANPVEASVFNSINSIVTQNGGVAIMPANTIPGQLITDEGVIKLPTVGNISALGKTTRQLSKDIEAAINPYLKDPLVTVRFMNFKVTILGEVARPGVINVNNERITILEALGQAGDLTAYSKREKLLLIRDSAGTQQTHRFNMTDQSLFAKPYYFLKPNDVIYVEANSVKSINTSGVPTVLPLILSTLSFLIIITNQFEQK